MAFSNFIDKIKRYLRNTRIKNIYGIRTKYKHIYIYYRTDTRKYHELDTKYCHESDISRYPCDNGFIVFACANNVSHRTRTVENLEMVEPHTSHELTFIIPPEGTPPQRDIANFDIGYCLDVELDKKVYNS